MTNEDENRDKVRSIFEKAQKLPIESNPFMKTRILAELRVAREKKRSFIWKSLALASPVFVAAVLILIFLFYGPSFKANIDQNILVKIEISEMKNEIAFAQIELPEGVYFYSKLYPQISEKRALVLAIDEGFVKGSIPIVVRSKEAGSKKLKVNFLDAEQKTVSSRYIKIDFMGAV